MPRESSMLEWIVDYWKERKDRSILKKGLEEWRASRKDTHEE